MGDTPLKLFVIVVTYKGKQWYDRCFTSLRNSTLPVQTIVVDNASNDGTVEYIKEHYPEIILIESKENLGFGKGNNLALKYAYEHGCDYVFLLNQDAWLDEADMFEKLIALSRRYPEYGVVSPVHMSADKKAVCMAIGHRSKKCLWRLFNDLFCGTLNEIYETDYINAAGWLLPRNTLDVLGGFDPLIFHFGEDDDYQNRARYHGLKIGLCPNVKMIHDHQEKKVTDYSRELFNKAELDEIAELLNLNVSFEYFALQRHYLKMYLKSMIKKSVKQKEYAIYKYRYIKKMRRKIEYSRKMNAIKQPNWIQ